ncbi:hypothetical protein BC332_28811 [Capsicum chinense]|nr:hypothetical protein BC332_28811 [Capsicum chinense]
MGGLGKTTLAKAVYNDERVKDHFELKAWFCVSEQYDAIRITKGLLQEIGLVVDDNLNQQQVKLKESLKGKRFLVVLDDVWNDNYNEWDDLRNLFVQGNIGSKIIVTTRKESVALMMGNKQISMSNLSIEVSWSLFKRHAFKNMDPMGHPELEDVGKQIAAKCKGLPLALKTLAGMLRSKSMVEGWKRILRSEIWELPVNSILPALMLSYNDLPPHLQRCFSYCAIFPKDYPFSLEQVIHLWIANGLIPQEDETIQDSGNQYFLELRSRSLFEKVPNPSQGNTQKFLMHDLVNDLAQITSSKLCIRLEESQGSHMLEKSRHLSYSTGYSGDFEKLTPLYKLEQLRTLLPINIQEYTHIYLSKRVLHNILPALGSLGALSLSHDKIKELPDDLFVKLKLLRFLDLSWTMIRMLPNSICVLYNLGTLLLSSCKDLEELPLQMEKLINLRHLDISNTSRLKMPLHLSKLKSLQVLVGAKFLLGGLRMADLGEAHNLYGSLSILELQNVVDRREALKAKIREKDHVEKLCLEWSESIADNSQTEREILNELHPHTNIKELQINGYSGTQFPNWLADHLCLKLLVQLSLSNCKCCFSLPALGQLPSLKFLSIRRMHRITAVMEEFYGSLSSKKPFNSLEKLEFAEMPEWKQWHVPGNGEFPTLQNLSIKNCPELRLETPIQLSSLKQFKVNGSPKVVLFDDAELFTSQLQEMKQIVRLSITDCNSLASLPISILPSTLKRIKISRCRKLKLERPVGYCDMFLEELKLVDCDSIADTSSPEYELVPRARELNISSCHSLSRFLIPTATGGLKIWDCENLEILLMAGGTQITSLFIWDCEKLKRLPEHMQELLPSLMRLTLGNCPEIKSFPEGGLPFNLQVLRIFNCKKLPCLRMLVIEHDGSDEEILADENWELPCSVRTLRISNLKTLNSQILKSLTSLESLHIGNLPQIQSRLEEGLPPSLSMLHVWNFPNLQALPVKRLPSSLSTLYIDNCPLLKPLLEFNKGEYWPKIAHISTIYIDGEYL